MAAGAARLGRVLPGCGYSLAGRGSFLPAYIKIIGIPMFVNNTPLFEVEKRITQRGACRSSSAAASYNVRARRQRASTRCSRARFPSITVAPAAFTDDRQASRYVITATTKIEFRDVKADKVLWANPYLQFREDYERLEHAERDRPACVPRPGRQRARSARHRTRPHASSARSSRRSSGRRVATPQAVRKQLAQRASRIPST